MKCDLCTLTEDVTVERFARRRRRRYGKGKVVKWSERYCVFHKIARNVDDYTVREAAHAMADMFSALVRQKT